MWATKLRPIGAQLISDCSNSNDVAMTMVTPMPSMATSVWQDLRQLIAQLIHHLRLLRMGLHRDSHLLPQSRVLLVGVTQPCLQLLDPPPQRLVRTGW